MKIYIAACFRQQEEVRRYAEELTALSHECTSSWRFEPAGKGDGSEPEHCKHYAECARQDLADIRRADCFLLLTEQVSASGGKHVEFGYALAEEKTIYLVGSRRAENVFHWTVSDFGYYPNWEAFKREVL